MPAPLPDSSFEEWLGMAEFLIQEAKRMRDRKTTARAIKIKLSNAKFYIDAAAKKLDE